MSDRLPGGAPAPTTIEHRVTTDEVPVRAGEPTW